MNKKLILLIILVMFLLIGTASAKEITTKVTDKTVLFSYADHRFILHTEGFGDMIVDESIYQNVMINDTIRFDTKSEWGFYYNVKVVKGEIV